MGRRWLSDKLLYALRTVPRQINLYNCNVLTLFLALYVHNYFAYIYLHFLFFPTIKFPNPPLNTFIMVTKTHLSYIDNTAMAVDLLLERKALASSEMVSNIPITASAGSMGFALTDLDDEM